MVFPRHKARITSATALLLVLGVIACVTPIRGDEDSHHYVEGENVVAWLNKIGPYHNPQETYKYYTLPFCRPELKLTPAKKWAGWSEVFEGSEFLNSDLAIPFGQNVPETAVCSVTLEPESAEFFAYAISNHYWYQMYIDDLPIWGMVGEIVAPEETIREIETHKERPHDVADSTFIFTHKRFTLARNGDQVIEVNLTSENPQEVAPGKTISFSYSVEWTETDKPFVTRFQRYQDYSFFEHQIHWFSIFNSFMMVIFLCGLVALILMRTLKRDYAKYMRDEEDVVDGLGDKGMGDDSGWKQVHGEVFRKPAHLQVFAGLIGSGYQLVAMAFLGILAAATAGETGDQKSATMSFVIIYALTSFVAGYSSAAYYRSHFYPEPSPQWKRVMFLTAGLLPGSVFVTLLVLNSVALSYNTINTIPFSMMVSTVLVWLLVSLPMVIGGSILGRRWSGKTTFPCRVNSIPRPIPPRKWYTEPYLVCLLTGVLPFGSIFMEMYFIFTSVWNYKFYYVYGFMLLVYVILAVVTCCVTIVAVYFLLNSEDYRWPWLSFLAAGSTAVYVFLYAVFFFFMKTGMTGFLQTSYYFAYSGLFCVGLGLLCGTIGFWASSVFVNRIYRNIKVD